ncbi:MAG: GNAT family N-acetyltransferase [Gorillibacterium sp.]|nr:GNAT family N-acetyltransferase [Gorillibacterium sp.]
MAIYRRRVSHLIRAYEELQMNAWPALQTLCYDGWLLRYAKGYTKRANSVHPIYPSQLPLDEKIRVCESFYQNYGLNPVFKLTEASEPRDLDEVLEKRGYQYTDLVSIQSLKLTELPEPAHRELRVSSELTEDWLDQFCRLSPERHNDLQTIREAFGLPMPECCYAQLMIEGHTVACGLAVMQNGHVGLFDIVTDKDYRRQGIGEAMVIHLLRYAVDRGVGQAYLQVLIENTAAMKLYDKLGFVEKYKQWYRIKGLSQAGC